MDSLMGYGIAINPLIPGRKEGSDRAEMVTQLLFGELYSVLDENEKWILIQNDVDEYQCWIDRKQHYPINANEFQELKQGRHQISAEILGETLGKIRIPFGSSVNYKSSSRFSDISSFEGETASRDYGDIENYAKLFLEAPYLWGGKSILGIDCSGFCQVVFSACGIKLPRDAYQQAEIGTTIEFIEEAKTSDLAYFDNKEGKITHVGILLGKDQIIHASGKVRIDKIDHQGIYNTEIGEYTHKLRIIKRISP
jgi:cell wall-associated NlpC family hydrolase